MSRGVLSIVVLALAAVAVSVAVAAWLSGRPGPPAVTAVDTGTAPAAGPSEAEILARVAALRERINDNPEDVEGWKMLGRSYMALRRYREAVEAWSWVKELSPRDPHAAAALEELAKIARERGVHKDVKP